MGDIHVYKIKLLYELKSEISKFSSRTRETISLLDVELQRAQHWLEQRRQHWAARVRSCEATVQSAQAALDHCLDNKRNQKDNGCSVSLDCSGQMRALSRAEAELQEAVNNLADANRWMQNLEDAAFTYKKKANSMNSFCYKDLTKAQLFLEKKTEALHDYLAVGTIASVGFSATGVGTPGNNDSIAPLLFGNLEPNQAYERNGYEYLTDNQGRVMRVSGSLYLGDGKRTKHQTEVGQMGYPSDEGGHLVATIFNGSPEGVNLIPQDSNLNRGAWRSMEYQWSNALKEGKDVNVDIQVVYLDGSHRPSGFQVEYTIDGNLNTNYFFNE